MLTRLTKKMHLVGCKDGWEQWDRVDFVGRILQVQEIIDVDWAKGEALCRCTPLVLPSLMPNDGTQEDRLYKLELANWNILEVELRVKATGATNAV